MKTKLIPLEAWVLLAALYLATSFAAEDGRGCALQSSVTPLASTEGVTWSPAGAAYKGDGLTVTPIKTGARLRCLFQRLEGEATPEGLWLSSTVTNALNDRFRVRASSVGRLAARAFLATELPMTGQVQITDNLVRFIRPGLTEEYSVSMDGVRQDFVVAERPAGEGELKVKLAVAGASVARTVFGAQLVFEHSGRKVAYSRLRATDVTGRELAARMEVAEKSEIQSPNSEVSLAVIVDDAGAVYPVRIDPTFSDANWISFGGFPGANGAVRAAAVDSSGNLYIGGDFTILGEMGANHIAKWDGTNWSALGSGMNGGISALAVSGTNIYAGGGFTSAGGTVVSNVAKWNGSSWSALGSGMNGGVLALAVSGSNVYAGGNFTTAGGIAANYIAKWAGSNWSPLNGGMDAAVSSLAVSSNRLYASGSFYFADGYLVYGLAQWDGTGWSSVGSGPGGTVGPLAVLGSDLYAGAGGGVSKWNGSSWSALGPVPNGGPAVLLASGSDLYAGTGGGVAKWNGSSWSVLGSGTDNTVQAVAVSGSNVYAGGFFTSAGGSAASYIAKWSGNSWSAMALATNVLNGAVTALAISGSDLYMGGNFTTAGGIAVNNITKWNGTSWSALGSGLGTTNLYPPSVDALAVSGSDVYVGGHFTMAGGSVANRVAKWNGNSWSSLGSGMTYVGVDFGGPPYVAALAVLGTNLYAGGHFNVAGGRAANFIAKWDGSSWSPVGGGMDTNVCALAVSGSDLYAGGRFFWANTNFVRCVAKWNGTNWSGLGSGMYGLGAPYVLALAVSGSNVYAGGWFTMAGGVSAINVAKWNGSSWNAMGPGLGGTVDNAYIPYALAASGSDLYAGGAFSNSGATPVNYIAKWDGSSWSALGSGMNAGVSALLVSGSDLYAGGGFTVAGGKGSLYVAKAVVNPPVLNIQGDGTGGYYVRFSGVPGSSYSLQRAPGLAGPWASYGSQIAPASGRVDFRDTAPPTNQGFYRASQP